MTTYAILHVGGTEYTITAYEDRESAEAQGNNSLLFSSAEDLEKNPISRNQILLIFNAITKADKKGFRDKATAATALFKAVSDEGQKAEGGTAPEGNDVHDGGEDGDDVRPRFNTDESKEESNEMAKSVTKVTKAPKAAKTPKAKVAKAPKPVKEPKAKKPAGERSRAPTAGEKDPIVAYGVFPESNRAKLLKKLDANKGKFVSVKDLMKAVYGNIEEENRAKTGMILKGLIGIQDGYKISLEIRKEKDDKGIISFGLFDAK